MKPEVMHLLQVLMTSERLTEARLCRALREAGFSPAQWRILHQLVLSETPLSLGLLAERLAFVKSNATQLIDRMEAEGLVRRLPDPGDRRSVLAQITEKGRQRYIIGLQAFEPVGKELLANYTFQEIVQLTRLVERLNRVWSS